MPHTHGFAHLLERQVTAPVQWEASALKLLEMGVTEVVEMGPGKTLAALLRRIDDRFRGSLPR